MKPKNSISMVRLILKLMGIVVCISILNACQKAGVEVIAEPLQFYIDGRLTPDTSFELTTDRKILLRVKTRRGEGFYRNSNCSGQGYDEKIIQAYGRDEFIEIVPLYKGITSVAVTCSGNSAGELALSDALWSQKGQFMITVNDKSVAP